MSRAQFDERGCRCKRVMQLSHRFRARRTGLAGIVVLATCLLTVAMGIAIVVRTNVGTSTEIRKEGTEAFLLGQMQGSLASLDEQLTLFRRHPASEQWPKTNPRVRAASQQFFESGKILAGVIDPEEVPVVEDLIASFERFMAGVDTLTVDGLHAALAGLEEQQLELRADLLEIQDAENSHLIGSLDELQRSEALLMWGIPVLLVAALLMSGLLIRSEFRAVRHAELERVNSAKDQFIASVSHELRTPLTSVVALSHELHENIQSFSDVEIAEFAGLIARESSEVSAIVEDLLVAARADDRRLKVRPEVVDVRREVARALATVDGSETLVVEGEAFALADGGRLRQILRNLIRNAQRYGGPRVRIEAIQGESEVRIVVADDGSGIPDDQRSRVFEPYAVSHRRPGAPDSVGLGLFVSRHLAELMGGTLDYVPENGWSRMVLTLPAARGTRQPLVAAR